MSIKLQAILYVFAAMAGTLGIVLLTVGVVSCRHQHRQAQSTPGLLGRRGPSHQRWDRPPSDNPQEMGPLASA